MKSATGINPLEQFPKEIWAEIFNSLNPEDRRNVRQVHPLFSNLMEVSQIGGILLPKVLQLDAFHEVFEPPSDFHSADYKFTKQLRCLSKTSREYFDRWIDNIFEKRMPKPDAYLYSYHNHINLTFGKNKDHQLLSRLLAAFGSGKNPAKRYFPRGFSVFFTEDLMDIRIPQEGGQDFLQELRTTFKNNIASVLSIIGPQIWHFRFFIDDREMTLASFTRIYYLFKELTSLVPNLRWLEFAIGGHEDEDEEDEAQENWNEKSRNRIKFLSNNPFPHLASLEKVSFHYDLYHPNMDACPDEILGAVVSANPHIKYLDVIDGEDGEILNLDDHQLKSLQHLQSLTLSHVLSPGLTLTLVEAMVNVQWPLRSIYLDLYMEHTSMACLFRFLEKYPTLENVQLRQLKRPQIADTDTWGYLNLPNLKNFHIWVGAPQIDYNSNNNIHFFFSLQFLLHCAKLTRLTWMLYDFDEIKLGLNLIDHEEPGKWLDFRAGLRILHDSNVWDAFPSLETCHVHLRSSEVEEHVRFATFCEHEYHRPTSDQKGLSVKQFSKSHKCGGYARYQNEDDPGSHCCLFLLE